MNDVVVKSEDEENDHSNESLCALTTLLQEVKKEEQKQDEEDQTNNQKEGEDHALTETFFDELYREELLAGPAEATTDEDLLRLEEMIAKKKRILNSDDHEGRSRKSRSQSPSNQSRKRKEKEHQKPDNSSKRPRTTDERTRQTDNESSAMDVQPVESNSAQDPQQPGSSSYSSQTDQAVDPEVELENLLNTSDFNSDDEGPTTDQKVHLNNVAMQAMQPMQPMFGFNSMQMMPGMFNPAANPMMANMPVGNYPMMGFPPGFYPPHNMVNMQTMGYGFPQMNAPVPSNENEVECLPVTSTIGLAKIPFKKIKLEKATSKTVPPAEDLKKKIIADCTALLDKLESPQPSGKFLFTPTVAKQNKTSASNSVLQKITNVSYNFQSIGPKQNLGDWGLRAIPDANAEIAKKISMSADRYFNKISENANTTARKLIKEEVAKADKQHNDSEDMEVEEPTLSSYFKNSMTQTDPLTCRECVVRRRKVGHAIAVQATVFTGSIGSQTDPEVRFNEQLTEGLTNNQLKAMYEFSLLIREPPKNTSAELRRLPEQLLNMYNLSQRQHRGPVPFVDGSAALQGQSVARDPRRFAPPGPQILSVHSLAEQHSGQQISVHMGRQNFSQHGPQGLPQAVGAPNYPQQRGPMVHQNNVQLTPGQMINGHENRHFRQNEYQGAQEQVVPGQHQELSLPDYPGHQARKNYGRGAYRR